MNISEFYTNICDSHQVQAVLVALRESLGAGSVASCCVVIRMWMSSPSSGEGRSLAWCCFTGNHKTAVIDCCQCNTAQASSNLLSVLLGNVPALPFTCTWSPQLPRGTSSHSPKEARYSIKVQHHPWWWKKCHQGIFSLLLHTAGICYFLYGYSPQYIILWAAKGAVARHPVPCVLIEAWIHEKWLQKYIFKSLKDIYYFISIILLIKKHFFF